MNTRVTLDDPLPLARYFAQDNYISHES